ncbi:MAG: hypothetical protein LT070_11480 [Solirubrobacteraceae bacterium]|nr:hypothetical protein [Solirubrobacteraceae bacterium]
MTEPVPPVARGGPPAVTPIRILTPAEREREREARERERRRRERALPRDEPPPAEGIDIRA